MKIHVVINSKEKVEGSREMIGNMRLASSNLGISSKLLIQNAIKLESKDTNTIWVQV